MEDQLHSTDLSVFAVISAIYIYICQLLLLLLLLLLNNYIHQWNISEIWNAPMTSHGSVLSFSSHLRRRCTVLRRVAWEEWWWRWPGAVVTDIDRKMGRPIFHHGVTCCEHGMYHLCIYICVYIYVYQAIWLYNMALASWNGEKQNIYIYYEQWVAARQPCWLMIISI